MASSRMSFFTCVFLFFLIFTHGIPSIVGRHLMNLDENNYNKDTTSKTIGPNNRDMQSNERVNKVAQSLAIATPSAPPSVQAVIDASPPPPPAPGHNISACRPTTPGHSPGMEVKLMTAENSKTKARVLPAIGVPGPRSILHFGIKHEAKASSRSPTRSGPSGPGSGHSVHN